MTPIPMLGSVRAEDLNPTTHATCAAGHRASARLRLPQIGSKLPTLAAALSVAALPVQ